MMTSPLPLRRVGTEIIRSRAVPVYELPNGERFAEVTDLLTEQPNLVSVDAAKLFKAADYPLDSVFAEPMKPSPESPAIPFIKLSEEEQEVASEAMLVRLFDRIRMSDENFNFLSN